MVSFYGIVPRSLLLELFDTPRIKIPHPGVRDRALRRRSGFCDVIRDYDRGMWSTLISLSSAVVRGRDLEILTFSQLCWLSECSSRTPDPPPPAVVAIMTRIRMRTNRRILHSPRVLLIAPKHAHCPMLPLVPKIAQSGDKRREKSMKTTEFRVICPYTV